MFEVNQDISRTLIKFIFDPNNFKIFPFVQLPVNPQDLLPTAHTLTPHNIQYTKRDQV
jgi:hypothetical protein